MGERTRSQREGSSVRSPPARGRPRSVVSVHCCEEDCLAVEAVRVTYPFVPERSYGTTAGHSPLLTRRRHCGRLRRLCRASWQEARVAVAVEAFVSPLSEHVSPEQPGGAPLARWSCIEMQPVACSWRTGLH